MDQDADLLVLTHEWVMDAAESPNSRARRIALDRIVKCEDVLRSAWIERFVNDQEPATRILARDALDTADAYRASCDEQLDFETRFAEGVVPAGVSWEWEYRFAVWMPRAGFREVRVFTDAFDVEIARLRSVGWPGQLGVFELPDQAAALFCGAWVVCDYSRSPRTEREALRWRREGRPMPPT